MHGLTAGSQHTGAHIVKLKFEMPHILLQGTDISKNIEVLDVHVEVKFSKEYYLDSKRAEVKLDEIKEKLEAVMRDYFQESFSSESFLSNHNFNLTAKYYNQ